MSRHTFRLAAIATLIAIPAIPVAASASALASVHPDLLGVPWGYVVARQAHATTTYTPTDLDRGNSAGGINRVLRLGVGKYQVTMPGLNYYTSAIAVSPLATSARRCVAINWVGIGSDEYIYVACFKANGVSVDTQFVATFLVSGTATNQASPPGYSFGFADQPHQNGGYQLNRRFNSHSGASNPVNRQGNGRYQAVFNALGSPGGNVQVTAVSSTAATCQASWVQSNAQMHADVQCRTTGTARVDTPFEIILTDGMGLKGPGGTYTGYLTANYPTSKSYTVVAPKSWSSPHVASQINRTAIGAYTVTLKGMRPGGAAVVTPLAFGAAICTIGFIGTTTPQKIGVRCFDPVGHPQDTKFSLSYLR